MLIGLTGARGILGRIAVNQLIARGHTVNPFDGDVCDLSALQAWAANTNMDAVLHFAAVVPTQVVQADPARAFRVNVGGTANLVSALGGCGRKPWLFYASTSHVYRPQAEPLCEDSPISPINPYGLSKRMGEQVVEASSGPAGLSWCVGRIFSFYHPEQTGSFLYPMLRRRFETEDLDQPFPLHGLDDVRDLSLADDLVAAIVDLTELQSTGTVNIGSGRGTRIADFVQSLAPKPLYIAPASSGKPTSLVADISRLRQILGR
jgi:UDP-glucose 4-epimerase/GDP-4-dehydro-6-deoxy-D-mannose reductase